MVKIGRAPNMDDQTSVAEPSPVEGATTTNAPAGTEPWKIRLNILKENIVTSINEVEIGSGNGDYLKSLIELFASELHIFMNKLTETEITTYTKFQLEAMKSCHLSKIISKDTNINEHQNLQIPSKLPKLELPKFHGDILKWSEFWDRFQSSVDSRNLTKTDKMAYLVASLGQDALAAVEGLDITSDNYDVAKTILKERYGKSGAVIDAHYEALLNIKQAHTSVDCMNTYNEIEKHLRILKALGEDTNHNNLRKIIINKYPEDLIYEIKCKVKIEEQSVDELRKLIEHCCAARVSTNKMAHLISTSTFTNRTKGTFKRKLPIGNTSVNIKRRRGLACIFCGGQHFNDNCKKFSSNIERKGKLKGRCYLCFKTNHMSNQCREAKPCFYCKGKHNRALCGTRRRDNVCSTTSGGNSSQKGISYLQTAIAQVQDERGVLHKCRLLLDTGSQRSYVAKQFIKTIKPTILEKDFLLVYTFGQDKPKRIESPRVTLELICASGCKREINLNVVPFIAHEISFNFREHHPNIKLKLADDGFMGSIINILIGNDYYFTFIKDQRKQLVENVYLVNTEFGWICGGQTSTQKEHVLSVSTCVQTHTPEDLGFDRPDLPMKEGDVSQLWELEAIGIKDCPNTTNEEEAVRHFNDTVKYDNYRYHVKWPWIQCPPYLPMNYGLALGRLVSLLKRLEDDILNIYDNTIREQEKCGVIERVDNFMEKVSHPIHYLPHHCVVKNDDHTKLRIVYDGSSKGKENFSSLNECMYKGPLLLENLVGLILRFRQNKIGIIADVEKAFLQLGLQLEDRDVTRFLWIKDLTKRAVEENLQCFRFCRVPFGVVSSPFLLNATIKYHLLKSENNVLRRVANNIYVDNLVLGTNSKEDATELFEKTYESLQLLSMNVRQWNSNDKDFLLSIPEDLKEKTTVTKVLGLTWNTEKDTLQIKTHNNYIKNGSNTKRKVLQEIASIYDPCGFITPLLLPAKLFLQKLWKLKLNWDTKLSEQLNKEWLEISKNLEEIQSIEIDRYTNLEEVTAVNELHCFVDASKDTYAAVVYIKSQYKENKKVKLLMAKSKLTPIKDQDNLQIPRLELLGMLIGSRLLKYISQNIEMSITKEYLWTDSQVVISWLQTEKLLPPFISRRVKEIKTSKARVLYVNTSNNPADIATRVGNLNSQKKQMWFEGPEFLKEISNYTDNWALTHNFCVMEGLSESDTNKENDANKKEGKEESAVNSHMLRKRKQDTLSNSNNREEIDKIRDEQELHFVREWANEVTDLTRSLGVFKDEYNILRCKGRVVLADLPYEMKYPILLPKDSQVTEDIIMETHRKNYHVGVSHTLSIIRTKYWIPQGRSRVQKVLKKCLECKKYGGGPYRLPQMPNLPEERVNYSSPFTFTGLDYLGPLIVTNDKGQGEKRWICLYTCLAVRAIHLEVVNDLSAEECTLALRRFTAQKSLPQLFLSDNATQFKLTAEVMTGPYCIDNKVEWKFIPELAPWHGGLYERLVGLVKHCLKRTLDGRQLNDTQIRTIVKEIELVLNNRPLTYAGTDPEHILKPIDFLRPQSYLINHSQEPYLCQSDTSTKQLLIEGWKRGQRMIEEFQKMFTNQYLMTLRERKDVRHKQSRVVSQKSPKIGDKVQIKGDTGNRVMWKVGTITALHKGRDGEVRVATVKVENKEYVRSIGHLYPLEIEEDIEVEIQDKNEDSQKKDEVEKERETTNISIPSEDIIVGRATRTAAQRAREKISKWTREIVQLIFLL